MLCTNHPIGTTRSSSTSLHFSFECSPSEGKWVVFNLYSCLPLDELPSQYARHAKIAVYPRPHSKLEDWEEDKEVLSRVIFLHKQCLACVCLLHCPRTGFLGGPGMIRVQGLRSMCYFSFPTSITVGAVMQSRQGAVSHVFALSSAPASWSQ